MKSAEDTPKLSPRPGAIATDLFERVEVRNPKLLDDWLSQNHSSDKSVWLVTDKRHVASYYFSMRDS
jgi:hypothetical protein